MLIELDDAIHDDLVAVAASHGIPPHLYLQILILQGLHGVLHPAVATFWKAISASRIGAHP